MTVIKETGRAKLLEMNGVKFWVQNRWVKDGTLTPAGVTAFERQKAQDALIAAYDATEDFSVVKETEKALCLRARIIFYNSDSDYETERNFWVPKSCIKKVNFIKDKIMEIESEFPHGAGASVVWEFGIFQNKKSEAVA
jgi:hypothetical protein